jgi:hypothetical protein
MNSLNSENEKDPHCLAARGLSQKKPEQEFSRI